MGVRALSRLFLLGLLWKTTEGCLGGQPLGFYPPAYGSSYGAAPYGPYAASRTRMASPSHTLVANSVDGDGLQQLSDCSQRFENQKLTCAQAFDRRSPSSEFECQQLCDQYATRCRGFQFDSLAGMCEVFDVDRMTAQRGPYAQDDQMEKDDQFDSTYKQRHRRYTSKNPFDEYLRDPLRMFSSSDSPGQYCEPSLLSALGVTYVQTDPGCRTALNPTAASSYVGAVEPLPSVDRLPPTNKLAAGVGPVQLSPPPATQTVFCPDGATPRVQLIDGIEVNRETKPLLGVQLDSPDACLHICQLNAHLDGTPFSRPCRAAAFDRSTGRCKIYEQAISPNGQLNYTPAKNSIYFEKFCIPGSEIPSGCEDVINRMPQHALDRRASGTGAIVTASTQINCIRQCLAASRALGFDCASASYFFDWPSENCYLSRFTRISRPDIYVSEKKELVDYIEMPKCLQQNGARSNWQRDAAPSSWSEWTKCDERTFTRSRHRNCSECRNRIETMPCISEAAYQHEFSNALMDTEIDTKKIAPSFESARRYKEAKKPPVDSAEASLFGEQDYDNQREVSFFGPPIVAKGTPNKKAEVPLDVELEHVLPVEEFAIRSNIRPIHPPAASSPPPLPLESAEELSPPFDPPRPSGRLPEELGGQFERSMERADVRLKSAVKQRNSEDEHDALLRKALEEARVEAAKEEDAHKKMESTSAEKQQDEKKPASDEKADDGEKIDCDPHVKCCPRPGPNARSARLHNCVMGFRVSGDGRQIACLSEEYCASSAAMAAGNGAFGRCFSLATGLLSVSAAAFWILFSE